MGAGNGRLGHHSVCQHVWTLEVTLGSYMICSAMHQLELLVDKTKITFFQQLNTFLSSLAVGDFNARDGSRESGDQWHDVLGPHAYGLLNDAGRELSSFLLCHEIAVGNTCFEKKNIHKQTWQHPKSKKWNCIDYVMMSQRDKKYCLDVCMRRGAYCNTDHRLVCVGLKFKKNYLRNSGGRGDQKMRRFDVEKLNASGNDVGGCQVADQYLESVLQKAGASWSEDGAVKEKCIAVSAALKSAADDVLGTLSRCQLDSFSDSQSRLHHCLTTGIRFTIGGCRRVRQRILLFFEEPGEIHDGLLERQRICSLRRKQQKLNIIDLEERKCGIVLET